MLDVCGYTTYKDLSNIKVIDPAAGRRIFTISLIERLFNELKSGIRPLSLSRFPTRNGSILASSSKT
jgi:hypothetical protein